jgi:hypothetical protein
MKIILAATMFLGLGSAVIGNGVASAGSNTSGQADWSPRPNGTYGLSLTLETSGTSYKSGQPILVSLLVRNDRNTNADISCFPVPFRTNIEITDASGARLSETLPRKSVGIAGSLRGRGTMTPPGGTQTCVSAANISEWGYHLGVGSYVLRMYYSNFAEAQNRPIESNAVQIVVTP